MVFSSLVFLFQFLPLFFLLYYIIPVSLRNGFLLFGSLFFYGWGEPQYLLLIFLSVIINYLAGLFMERTEGKTRSFIFILSLIYNIGMLVFFKYTDFLTENINRVFRLSLPLREIALPLGISFYTFQIMSYTIDVYRGKVRAEHSAVNLGTYLCMFPQLIAGPIVVYTQVAEELKSRRTRLEDLEEGLKIFVLGLGSKVLIANNIGAMWEDMGKIGFSNLSTPLSWLGLLAFTLQIYFDFNGYSLMAIGLGKMLGFTFPQNFNYPYISRSVTEFWRRWHMTLSGWFREYLYIPLGGNRKGFGRMLFNLLAVWLVTGLWHGAGWNFVLWGLYFFLLLTVEKLFLKKYLDKGKVWPRIYFWLALLFSWLLFAMERVGDIPIYLKRMFSFAGGADWIYYLRSYGIILLLGLILSTPVFKGWYERHKKKTAGILLLFGIFLLSVAYLVDAAYNPFLYFRF